MNEITSKIISATINELDKAKIAWVQDPNGTIVFFSDGREIQVRIEDVGEQEFK